ncbi:selenoprotein K isoform X3 [Strongylocentrotus purpuratus]|uniref:Selenoprotein K n=2 Tax=Strongylocentrotus purpuratus TaxID=7668 RepID=A0A7M7PVR6_STRPU|nr:selenoprotein K isoform X3 [Strongylocentrotus purpuratus]
MPYLSQSGQVMDSRSPWRLSYIPELFWGAVNFISLFFRTMFSPQLTNRGTGYTSDYRQGLTGNSSNGRGPGGPPAPPRRRMGGFGGRRSGPAPPPAAGGG